MEALVFTLGGGRSSGAHRRFLLLSWEGNSAQMWVQTAGLKVGSAADPRPRSSSLMSSSNFPSLGSSLLLLLSGCFQLADVACADSRRLDPENDVLAGLRRIFIR